MSDVEDFFEHAPCGLVIADKDGRIVRMNHTLARWLGVAADASNGQPFSRLLTVGGRIYYETHLVPSLRMHGKVEAIALDLVGKEGRPLPMLVNASEQRDRDDAPTALRFAPFDASERRLYEQNLLQSRAAARAEIEEERSIAELREQFIAVLGHDLRNPIASISSGIGLLGKEQVSPRGLKVLELMAGSVTRAKNLIENVMDFARAGLGGGIGVEAERNADVARTIEQVVAELRSIAPDREIQSVVEIDVPVRADPDRLGQLVSNLLGNALTHGDPAQPVVLHAATIAGLFKPFFRGSVRPSQQGLGLGLHITSEIAKAHGGRVDVTSDERLTTFTFTMPLAA